MHMLEIQGLRKAFGSHGALDGIDLQVAEGTICALLGPNGAGKTTLVRILATLLAADGGQAQIAGHDLRREPAAVRAAIGMTGQFSTVDPLLIGEENLLLMADLHHIRRLASRVRVADLISRFDLREAAHRISATSSGGMRRRLDPAMTVVGELHLLFLDEPTTGLDPRRRHVLWQDIQAVSASRMTILLTTQYLEEADQLAGTIALLDRGTLVAGGTPEELKRLVPGGHIRLQFTNAHGLSITAGPLGEVVRNPTELALQVPTDGSARSLNAVPGCLDEQTWRPPGLQFIPLTSTTCFLPSPASPVFRFRTMAIFRASLLCAR